MARENFRDAQIGFVIPWLQDLTEEQRNSLQDICLLDHLIRKTNGMGESMSKYPIERILKRAKQTVENLKVRDCGSMDISDFVNFSALRMVKCRTYQLRYLICQI